MHKHEKILPAQVVNVSKHSLCNHLFGSQYTTASVVDDMQMPRLGLLLI